MSSPADGYRSIMNTPEISPPERLQGLPSDADIGQAGAKARFNLDPATLTATESTHES